ncbi:hypothetical protein K431DRAFT_287800 [Polychaeton citri CBS 116435]|uniref:Uncharacterized protein n=1 Tax=Polychaeton citri CBS 116435 TaxID=1314669 RepID=A0A9P4Q4I2_9PEZI|nr:hypothetical protein K431DRAFT_287800 [Polychaeton citri CBS 116435]
MKRDHVREKIELAQQVSVLKERVGDAEWKAYRVDSMSAELEALNAKLDEAGKNGEASCCMIRERDHTIETLLARM